MIIALALGLCFGGLLAVRIIYLMIRGKKEGKPYHRNVDSDAPPPTRRAQATSLPIGKVPPSAVIPTLHQHRVNVPGRLSRLPPKLLP